MLSSITEGTGFSNKPIAACRLPVAGEMLPEMDSVPNFIEFYFLLRAIVSSSSFQCEKVFRRVDLLLEPTRIPLQCKHEEKLLFGY
jgi:hypothetical protein